MAQGQAKSATFLLKLIREKQLDAKQLTTHQRRLCLRYLLEEEPGLSEYELADLLGTSRAAINRYKHQIIEQDGWIVDRLDTRLYAANLIRRFHIWVTKLEQKGAWAKAASLQKDLTEMLLELGVLKGTVHAMTERSPQAQITFLEIVKLAVGRSDKLPGSNGVVKSPVSIGS